MTKYELINPYIEGQFDRTFNGKTHIDAAQDAWESISEHITNNIPRFAFTLKKVSDGSLHHFQVTEKVNDDNVNYNVTKLNIKTSKKQQKQFDAYFDKFKNSKVMTGGQRKRRRYKDDDDDDDDDEFDDDDLYDELDFYRAINVQPPIYYWWYYPSWYHYDHFFVPTFTGTPYIDIVYPGTTTTTIIY